MNLYQRQPEEMSPESLRGIQPSELGNVELNPEQTKAQALQSAMSELEEELKKRLHNGCSSIIEETRSRLRKELSAALEAFGEDASARLRALQQEQVAESKSKIQLQMAERVREQVNEIQSALSKPCAELKGWNGRNLQLLFVIRKTLQDLLNTRLAIDRSFADGEGFRLNQTMDSH